MDPSFRPVVEGVIQIEPSGRRRDADILSVVAKEVGNEFIDPRCFLFGNSLADCSDFRW
jgi:hypothetical protein